MSSCANPPRISKKVSGGSERFRKLRRLFPPTGDEKYRASNDGSVRVSMNVIGVLENTVNAIPNFNALRLGIRIGDSEFGSDG